MYSLLFKIEFKGRAMLKGNDILGIPFTKTQTKAFLKLFNLKVRLSSKI